MEQHTAYIALGGNVGDVEATLLSALRDLEASSGIVLGRVSRFYRTAPVGGPEGQKDYLNAAAELHTTLSPGDLLEVMQSVERRHGRDRAREERWGPRTCDLDLLLYGQVVWNEEGLTIPHPRMHERMFVLQPLAEIAPNAIHPVCRQSVQDLLARQEAER